MKKIGFFGCAEATTLIGEVTEEELVGLETVRGKSSDPPGGGTCAGGAGRSLELGDHVIGTGGVDGYDGCFGGGLGSVVACLPVPQLVKTVAAASSTSEENKEREWGMETTAASNRMTQPSESERPMADARWHAENRPGIQPKSEV
jgi:hypothetical protein